MIATKKQRFSLVELIVSMSVLTIIMLALVNFYSAAQNGWTNSAKRSEMYENASAIFNIISRDIQTICYNEKYPYHQGTTSSLSFMSSTQMAPSGKYESPYFEVHYVLSSGWFSRACVADKDSNGNASSAWNPTNSSWYASPDPSTDSDSYRKIAPGITTLTFTGKNKTGGSTSSNELPAYLTVEIEMMDKNNLAAYNAITNSTAQSAFKTKNAKKFTKTYYLGDRL